MSTTVRTMCPMNCHPTLCGMLVDIAGGKPVAVRGDPDNPDSRGFLCIRGRAAPEIHHSPQRLLRPLVRDRRDPHAWRSVSWEEALDRVAERIGAVDPGAFAIWGGHGNHANGYGVFAGSQLMARFANLYGCQSWTGQMICWGLGGFGIGLTGTLEVNSKEDMGRSSRFILLWGANLASQPLTGPHVVAARKRGARVVTIDVRRTEAAALSDAFIAIRPGTDSALALAMMHVIIAEGLHDPAFIARHTIGFDDLAAHVRHFTPEWASGITVIAAEGIVALARDYATLKPGVILIGGSSMQKRANGWMAGRAISCLPALTGQFGSAGGGLGPRHGALLHGSGLVNVTARDRRPPGTYVPAQMSAITAALADGRVRQLMLVGTNMLSSYADAGAVAAALARTEFIVAHDLFENETTRRFADVVLPATSWLEDIGCKATNTHLYLTERALAPAGEARPLQDLLKDLAARLDVADFYPWPSQEALLDTILDHPATGHATIAALRRNGGMRRLNVSEVAYPSAAFQTPSGKVELRSESAAALGLPPLPDYLPADPSDYPLTLCQGRSLTHFHAFYDHGRALPTLVARDSSAEVWISPDDAAARSIANGTAVRVHNERGGFGARALVTDRIPSGVLWMHDGWVGGNDVTSGAPVLPDAATGVFPFTVGQATFDAMVEVSPA